MIFIELLLVAIGLSMDAFAVAICRGLNMKKWNVTHSFIIALFFGAFQGIMPIIGWFLGSRFEQYITSVDHWLAFLLLSIIGVNMLKEASSNKESCPCNDTVCCQSTNSVATSLDLKELFLLAIATSIDALAVGITFAFLGIDIIRAATIISITTFLLSFAGVIIGNRFGSKYEKKATIAGGIILIIMGLKILMEHLGVF